MNLHLKGKTALVTGGARGLGAAICVELAKEGVSVGINYASNSLKAENLAKVLEREYGVQAIAICGDVANETDVIGVFDRMEGAFGKAPDILINNAGICPIRMIIDTDFEEFKRVMAVNVDGVFLCSREFARRRIALNMGGRIVNIASQAAFNGAKRGKTPYSASKGAVVSFTISFAKEVAKYGIYVNSVAPGMMLTDLTRVTLEQENEIEKYNASITLGRLGELDETALAVLFLASDAASYSTGTVLDVSGGIMSR